MSAEATVEELHAGFARLWFDLAGHAAHQQSFAIRRLAGVDRLLYGSDYPFTSTAQVARNLDDLRTSSALSPAELDTQLRHNALRLLSRFGGDR
jgi:predicted TIM-barrel fold metal-dependent hydrolase